MAMRRSLLFKGLIYLVYLAAISVPCSFGQTTNQYESDRKRAEATHDRRAEAKALHSLGEATNSIGQSEKALRFLNQALSTYREINDRAGEASTLTSIGEAYWSLGELQKAFEFFSQALPKQRDVDERGEAVTLNDIGEYYAQTSRPEDAVKSYTQALSLERKAGNRGDEAVTLNNIGAVYAGTGQPEKALQSYQESLAIDREVQDHDGEAIVLSDIGTVYATVGQPQKALHFYDQALPIERQEGDRRGEANTLGTVAGAYLDLHQPEEALRFYQRALRIERELKDRRGEALTLNNIGATCARMHQARIARHFYNAALTLETEPGDATKAFTLWGLGSLENADALQSYLAALEIARSADDPDLQGAINSSLMEHFRGRRQFAAAIFFGDQSVHQYQQIRSHMQGLDRDVVTSFVRSKSDTYRQLAELLAQQDRLPEAERILDLLKEEELKETVRGTAAEKDSAAGPPLSDTIQEVARDLARQQARATDLVALSRERDALQTKTELTPAELTRLDHLNDEIAKGNAGMRQFFDVTLFQELGGTETANTAVSHDEEESSSIRSELKHLPQRTVAVYTLLTDQHTYLIVITPTVRIKHEGGLSGQQLVDKVLAVREELRSAGSSPAKDLLDLYDALIVPILPDLQAAQASTILWSLDGVLRYLPMNALYNGSQYLIEQYNNVVITPASRNHLLDPANAANGRLLAMGLSKSYLGEQPLQAVDAELNAIVRDPQVPPSHGPVPGRLLENDSFTLATFQELSVKFPIVHIASHFIFDPSSLSEPYLLLGGDATGGAGYRLTTSEMSDKLEFTGVQLLTLSACSTALAGRLSNGREMDSLGMIAQKNDAAAVLSTLWDVDDASTSLLMSDFYARWISGSYQPKVEALRQAQLDLLHSKSKTPGTLERGTLLGAGDGTAAPGPPGYGHPHYWAPFVLIGNFQ